jgi:staphylococcal nuclease domain-containing protein 1
LTNCNDSQFHRILISYIASDLKVYIQYSAEEQTLKNLQSALHDIFGQMKPIKRHWPKIGELIAAKYSVDHEWYRARVENIQAKNCIQVYFLDYGNRETISDISRLAILPSGRYFSIVFARILY